jgi:hypothetical protein
MTALEQTMMDATHYQMLRDVFLRDREISAYTAGVLRDLFEAAERRERRHGRYRTSRKNRAHY